MPGSSVPTLTAQREGAKGHTSGRGFAIAFAMRLATVSAVWRCSPRMRWMARLWPAALRAASPNSVSVPIARAPGAPATPFRGFMLDQDTGGAIRAAGRTDIYMGTGPGAEELAGRQLNEGELYYLAVK